MIDFSTSEYDEAAAKQQAVYAQTQQLRRFVDSYTDQLREVEEALSESLSKFSSTDTDTPEPISIDLTPVEHTSILQLIQTANIPLNKLVSVFTHLIIEMRWIQRTAQDKFFPPLAMFDTSGVEEGETQMMIGRMMPFLTDLSHFVTRCHVVVCNTVRQLAALYHPSQRVYANLAKHSHLLPLVMGLSNTLTVLMTFDKLLCANKPLVEAWGRFQLMLRPIQKEPGRFSTNEEAVGKFDTLFRELHSNLFDPEACFERCVTGQAFDLDGVIEVKNNKVLRTEFTELLRIISRSLTKAFSLTGVDDSLEASDVMAAAGTASAAELVPGFFGLCALYSALWGAEAGQPLGDKKLAKEVAELTKKVATVPLWCNKVWSAAEFLAEHAIGVPKNVVPTPTEQLASVMKGFQQWVREHSSFAAVWMARMEANAANRLTLKQTIDLKVRFTREGILLAHRISERFRLVVALHTATGASLQMADLRALCHCVVILKAIESTFSRRAYIVAEAANLMTQRVAHTIMRILAPARRELEAGSNRLTQANLDVLASVSLAFSMLRGCATAERRAVLRVALAIAAPHPLIAEQAAELSGQLLRYEFVSEISHHIFDACNGAFLYWSRELVPHQLNYIYKNAYLSSSLPLIISALNDVVPLMRKSIHCEGNGEQVISRFREEVLSLLHGSIIDPLQRDIDAGLRVQSHLHLKVSDKNPLRDGVNATPDLLLTLRPFTVVGQRVDIKQMVSHYLARNFYNTNTVALYDWRTYEVMKNLARAKYGLEITDAHLPNQTLDQGLDILIVMRKIDEFVANYTYNLNNQFFVERQSDSKTLNTIGIQNVANSIRTHGTGVLNTTVNFTYQFLLSMFTSFSQFLFDEHIKNPLSKEVKYFRDHRQELDLKYPFERAEKFNKDIRKLGTMGTLTYLDRFRTLITKIGNAMGYVRMVRSGGLLACADATKFIPDLKAIPNFEQHVVAENLSPESIAAAKALDQAIANMSQSFNGGFEYFALLVQVFAPELRSVENHHLKNFYIIVPALVINYVENLLAAKDKVTKKASHLHADGWIFTDDGFAIGVAYILKLLDQQNDFDSLHFFEAAQDHYKQQEAQLEKIAAAAKNSKAKKEEQQTTVLNIRKIKSYQMEFDLLRFSFSGAKIFFDN